MRMKSKGSAGRATGLRVPRSAVTAGRVDPASGARGRHTLRSVTAPPGQWSAGMFRLVFDNHAAW